MYIAGDFNLHVEKSSDANLHVEKSSDANAVQLTDILNTFNFMQQANVHTHNLLCILGC